MSAFDPKQTLAAIPDLVCRRSSASSSISLIFRRFSFTPIVAWQFEEGFGAPNHKYFHLALPVTIEDGTVTEGTMVVRYPNGQLVALHDMPLDTEEEALAYLRRKERERRGRGLSLRAA